ncbi:MAG: cytochrome C oxidase subunit IV family protein [Acidobacteriaceae bacterium]|jgi:cytochrome c oxidase subunit 4|nr:cytochrome C oxidase subunit IV family protein [Acidobacteriaceae bacterium]
MSATHIVPKKIYFAVFAALMVFTAITVAVSFVDLGPLNTVVALGIAITKATLVVLYFMHVKYSPRLTKLVVLSSLFWLVILLVMTMGDYVTRDWRTYGMNQPHSAPYGIERTIAETVNL